MNQLPTLVEMLEAGVHFGHRVSRWHPKMEPFIFTQRNGVHVINLETTREKLAEAATFVKILTSQGKLVLFLGTKKHIAPIVEEAAKRCGMPYINQRWIGGLVTNFSEIKKLIQRYNTLKKEQITDAWEKYTKRERLKLAKEVEKMDGILAGNNNLHNVPDAIFVVDMRVEKTAVREANQAGVPLVGVCDTNVNPEKATHIIPANDDSVRSITMIAGIIADAAAEGRAAWEKNQKAVGVTKPKERKEQRAFVVATG